MSESRGRFTPQPSLLGLEPQSEVLPFTPIPNRFAANGTKEKLRGAVYTPQLVAEALAQWAIRAPSDRVLDPACGDGVFLRAAAKRLTGLGGRIPQVVGVDIDEEAAVATGAANADFFQWAENAPEFDVVLGNPPFVRSHLFAEQSRTRAFARMRAMGLAPSRLMSTWAPFLTIAVDLLCPSGRLAFVIPEEMLAVGYAMELRTFLRARFRQVVVCLPPEAVFPEVQQSVLLLLCENDGSRPAGLFSIAFEDLLAARFERLDKRPTRTFSAKWTHLLLRSDDADILANWLDRLNWKPFIEYGTVEVGIVTGCNDFFLVTGPEARKLGVRHFLPVVSRTRDLSGLVFSARDFDEVDASGAKTFLLNLTDSVHMSRSLQARLRMGEADGVPTRYKCRLRRRWYNVPSVWLSQAVLFRQIGDIPRIVHLSKKSAVTDTLHRVSWRNQRSARAHVSSFVNSLTLVLAELTGRSYGGGVLELMPSEANALRLPAPSRRLDAAFLELNALFRSRDALAAVDFVDRVVLPRWMTREDRVRLRSILDGLISRRKRR